MSQETLRCKVSEYSGEPGARRLSPKEVSHFSPTERGRKNVLENLFDQNCAKEESGEREAITKEQRREQEARAKKERLIALLHCADNANAEGLTGYIMFNVTENLRGLSAGTYLRISD